MSGPLTTHVWREIVEEDIVWLKEQPATLERDHIIGILAVCEKSTTQQFMDFKNAVKHNPNEPHQ